MAAEVARRIGIAFLCGDTIEQTILRSTAFEHPPGLVGYVVALEVAADPLRTGVGEIAECVNPLAGHPQYLPGDRARPRRPGARG